MDEIKDIVQNEFTDVSNEILLETLDEIKKVNSIKLPVAELTSLGAGVSSLIPSFNTLTTSEILNGKGLFRITNMGPGDVLKNATKFGDNYAAFKTPEGVSRIARVQEVGEITKTTTTVLPPNPATIMMATALYSVQQEIKEVEKVVEDIKDFLIIAKESKIEADLDTLNGMIAKYKDEWNNETFMRANYQVAFDIFRDAKANVIEYRRLIEKSLANSKSLLFDKDVKQKLSELSEQLKYYRISLFTYSYSDYLCVLFGGNFTKGYIEKVITEIMDESINYRKLFNEVSLKLEDMGRKAIDGKVLKGIGIAGEGIGELIDKVPAVENSAFTNFMKKQGETIQDKVVDKRYSMLQQLGKMGNPETERFINNLSKMVRIFNQTKEVCFDKDNIYLIEE